MTTVDVVADRSVVQALESMLLIRAFEEKSASLQAAGKAGTMCTSVGQEASAVGVVSALGRADKILTNHRSAGHLLAAAPIQAGSSPRSWAGAPATAAGKAARSTFRSGSWVSF